jgi:hypothetical protein
MEYNVGGGGGGGSRRKERIKENIKEYDGERGNGNAQGAT